MFAIDRDAHRAPDVRMVRSSDPAPPAIGDAFAIGDAAMLQLQVTNLGLWQITNGDTVTVWPNRHADQDEVRAVTLGSAWAAIGYQRGWSMWHGSAVIPAGCAEGVLFAGPQGAGKSTLAAQMARAGGRLISDDLVRIDQGASAMMLHPSGTRLKLWRDAVGALQLGDRVIGRDRFREDKYHCELLRSPIEQPVLLGAIIVLRWGDAIDARRLHGGEALTAVLADTCYRPIFLQLMDRLDEQTRGVIAAVASVPVYRLTRPRNLAALPILGECVRSLLGVKV